MNNEAGRFYPFENLYKQLTLLKASPINVLNAERILYLNTQSESKQVALTIEFAQLVNSVMGCLPDEQSFPDLVYWEMPFRENSALYTQEYKNLLKDGIVSGRNAPREWIEINHEFNTVQKREMKVMRRKMVRKVPNLGVLRQESENGDLLKISGIGLRRMAFWYLASSRIK